MRTYPTPITPITPTIPTPLTKARETPVFSRFSYNA